MEGIYRVVGELVDMEKMTILRDNVIVAELTRVLDLDSQSNKVRVDFTKDVTPQDKYTLKDILSKNISMFGKAPNGSIKWFYLKKGSIEQWVFAGTELEKRGFTVERDAKTTKYMKKLIAAYFPQSSVEAPKN